MRVLVPIMSTELLAPAILSDAQVMRQGFDFVVFPTDKENELVHNVRRREERWIRPGGRDAKWFRTAKEKRGAL